MKGSTTRGVILDVDGVMWLAGRAALGACDLISSLTMQDIGFCLLTNDCSVGKAARLADLASGGLEIRPEQIVMPSEIANRWLIDNAAYSIMYLGAPSCLPEIAKGLAIKEQGSVDAVVVGDLFDYYKRSEVDRAVKALENGARLVALQRNRLWSDGCEWHVDNGFWVAGFEYVANTQAVITGKPSPSAYLTALERINGPVADKGSVILVSDDAYGDLKGGKEVGLTTAYFGPPGDLPPWVDHRVFDMASLRDLLTGGRND